ncbi:MAG: flagellin hook IN motif-containing protein [Phycisphaerales bacterium]
MASISSLTGVNTALQNVRDITANAAKNFAAQRAARADAQANINAITSTITSIADLSSAAAVSQAATPPGFFVFGVSKGVAKVHVDEVNPSFLGLGGTLNVNINVTRSAQVGALLLSFGGPIIDLNSTATAGINDLFKIEIRGRLGSRELSFTSGTSIANVRDAINTFTGDTGVIAKVVGQSGIRLESADHGRDEFVGVRILEHARARGTGIHYYSASNNNVPNTAGATVFSLARWGVEDAGQDLEATINNSVVRGRGLEIIPTLNANFQGSLFLTVERAQTIGQFHAFSVRALPSQNEPSNGTPPTGLPTSPDEAQASTPTYSNAGVINPRITSKSVDLRG